MCGIAGLVGWGWRADAFTTLFADIGHRGPDDAGSVKIGDVQLGMNRLRFRGPLVALPVSTGRGISAFNGQVYGLLRPGGTYEALADGLEHEIGALNQGMADGMYACATVSTENGALRLITDTHFIKPMYYHTGRQGVAFCSEAGPLLRLAAPSRIDRAALVDLFAYGWYLDSRTFARNLYAAWDHDVEIIPGGIRAVEKEQLLPRALAGDAITALRQAIGESVRRCTQGAGPFGLALSGGLDSSILAWELNQAGVENMVTISVRGMDDDDGIDSLNQLGFARGGAWETWTHRVVRIRDHQDFLRRFEASTLSFGQPSTMSSLPLYHCLAEAAAAAGVRVLLTGEGVDELFGGYASYAKVAALASPLDYYHHPQRDYLLRMLFGETAALDSRRRFDGKYGGCTDIRWIERDIRLTRLLVRSDACLMARSIEGRVPFLHNGIPEMALSLPWHELVGGAGKRVLRQAYREALGPLAEMKKTRFKASDSVLWLCLAEPALQARLVDALAGIFGRDVIERSLAFLGTDAGFDADILCLLMSLAFLIEKGWIHAHSR